jgi:hypothetical protein
MFAFLRAFLRVFVAAQFLMPGTAEAQSHPTFCARILMDDDVQEILHCPLCSYPVSDGPTFFVRTEEGLNVAFTNASTAVGVVELLNLMAYAQDRCEQNSIRAGFRRVRENDGASGQAPVTGPAGNRRCVWTVAPAPRLVCPDGSRSAALFIDADARFRRCESRRGILVRRKPPAAGLGAIGEAAGDCNK